MKGMVLCKQLILLAVTITKAIAQQNESQSTMPHFRSQALTAKIFPFLKHFACFKTLSAMNCYQP